MGCINSETVQHSKLLWKKIFGVVKHFQTERPKFTSIKNSKTARVRRANSYFFFKLYWSKVIAGQKLFLAQAIIFFWKKHIFIFSPNWKKMNKITKISISSLIFHILACHFLFCIQDTTTHLSWWLKMSLVVVIFLLFFEILVVSLLNFHGKTLK